MGTKAKDEDRKGRLNRGDSIFDGGKKKLDLNWVIEIEKWYSRVT